MHFHRVRVVLRGKRRFRLHALQAAQVYGLVSAAVGRARRSDDLVPDGVLLDTPERARVVVHPDENFAFGLTLLRYSDDEARRLVNDVRRGLESLGQAAPKSGTPLRGTFSLRSITDRVGGSEIGEDVAPEAFGVDHVAGELNQLRGVECVTLRFDTPLRMQRPHSRRQPGHGYLDDRWFGAHVFVKRVAKRLRDLGVDDDVFGGHGLDARAANADDCRVHSNRLHWLDMQYGPKNKRKALGGSVGRVVIDVLDPRILPALVWGQYVRAGNNTRFGFGGYRIEELGAEAYPCPRSTSLLDLAVARASTGRIAGDLELPSGRLRSVLSEVVDGQYEPRPPFRVTIPSGKGKRSLTIPARVDRAIQKVLLAQVAPGLDVFFEDSSIAFRKGWSRHRAARRIQRAWRDGFRFALRTDFARFFDTIDRAILRDRLEAYLADDRLVSEIMGWVRHGNPDSERGLPTGAPLSPVLANLFLDRFDETLGRDGRRLVRYADDFVVLFRERRDADAVFEQARAEAERLELALNSDKTGLVELDEPFTFLGFRFERRDRWSAQAVDTPTAIEDLGWEDATRDEAPAPRVSLAGERAGSSGDGGPVVIVGPGVAQLARQGKNLVIEYDDDQTDATVPFDELGMLALLGRASIAGDALDQLLHHATPVIFAEPDGRWTGLLESASESLPAGTVEAQVHARHDAAKKLAIARALIHAKIHNYAALATTLEDDDAVTKLLRQAAEECLSAESRGALLGIEGAAAKRWYKLMQRRIGRGFSFTARVAPGADDPVNVLLNLGHSLVHRLQILAIRSAGLVPTLGLLHEPRAGHAALASDLQEPFRHLVDRSVIDATRTLTPGDFQRTNDGPFRLVIRPRAMRTFVAMLFEAFAIPVRAAQVSEPLAYRAHMAAQAKRLRSALLDPDAPFRPFQHP